MDSLYHSDCNCREPVGHSSDKCVCHISIGLAKVLLVPAFIPQQHLVVKHANAILMYDHDEHAESSVMHVFHSSNLQTVWTGAPDEFCHQT